MLDVIKSDVRKLLTVRSTYILMALATLFGSFMAFYIEAWWGKDGSPAGRLSLSPLAMHSLLTNAAGAVATFVCIIAILQVGHEYRYNTIMYTLTASSNRLKVYASKLITIIGFSLVAASLSLIVIVGAYMLGLSVKGAELPAQTLDLAPELLRIAFYFIAYGVLGFLLGILLRNLIAAITVLFVLPSMIEPLLGLLLRDNSVYLPVTALDQVVGSQTLSGATLSPNTAVLVGLGYLVGFGILGWILFIRRDAN